MQILKRNVLARLAFAGLVVGMIAMPAAASAATTSVGAVQSVDRPAASYTAKTTAKLNLRKKATVKSTRLSTFKRGAHIKVTCFTRDAKGNFWFRTSNKGKTGYVHGAYVEIPTPFVVKHC